MRAPHLSSLSLSSLSIASLAFLTVGCNTAQYRGREGYDGSCPLQIEYPCKVQPAGAPPGTACEGDPAKLSGLAQQIPGDASYPSGCAIIVPIPTADESGQCIVAGSCRCTSTEDAGKNDGGSLLEWICFESHY